jgi:vacuolar protein sorting-associated protein VTA1
VVLQAQKFCKFAASALQYEDIPTAIDNLEKCLRILKTGK